MAVQTQLAPLGVTTSAAGAEFRVWAPRARAVELLLWRGDAPDAEPQRTAMRRGEGGVLFASAAARPGDFYLYSVDAATPVPDPVSRYLPEGVHGRTQIVDTGAFLWTDDAWQGLPLREYVIYELHVGTFSPEQNFDGVIERLDYLRELGVTAIEIMPVAAFPGTRNWGYDGVGLYAVQANYGGPYGLQRLVNAAHACGLAVILDVVYNHLGNEGNYLRQFGPYFTDRHKTPWGEAVNYDQPGSEGVRRFVVENALYWVREYHLDGLRLDAVQTIKDDSPRHILAEITERVHALARELGREVCVIAETDENDAKIVTPAPAGYGVDALWSDDFHHAAQAFFSGEHQGYYQDFGRPEQITCALEQGFVFQGERFNYWGRPRGTPSSGMTALQHVICIQNHDQVGNRARGERLTMLVPRGLRKLLAALLLLAPETPLIFMGQEYDEPAPFQFFTNYGDPKLQKAVSEGRRKEFKDFDWKDVPDPEDPATFERSRLDWHLALRGDNAMLRWYRELLAIRKRLVTEGERTCSAEVRDDVLTLNEPRSQPCVLVIAALAPEKKIAPPEGWREVLCSDDDGYEVRVLERA